MLTVSRDRRLVLERVGQGTPRVLALHGWGRGRQDWRSILAGMDAFVPDLPGFGLTAAPSQPWGARDYAAFLRPVLDEMQRPILAGHSFGGRVAVCLASLAPDRVGGLVLTGAPLVRLGGRPKPKLAFRAGRRLHRLGLLSDARMEHLRYSYGSADYRAATGVMRQVLVKVVQESYEGELAAILAPTAFVWGASDAAVPAAVATSAAALMPNARVEIVPGAGHLLEGSLADRVRSAILAKLADA